MTIIRAKYSMVHDERLKLMNLSKDNPVREKSLSPLIVAMLLRLTRKWGACQVGRSTTR